VTVLVIYVPVEGAPAFRLDCLNSGEEARLMEWLQRSRALVELADAALDLDLLLQTTSDEPEEAA
jgi:hypothetical protein